MEKTKMETMRIALAANNLPTSGTYEQMLNRLQASGQKGKPGPKPKSMSTPMTPSGKVIESTPAKDTCVSVLKNKKRAAQTDDEILADPKFDAFCEREAVRLTEQGMNNFAEVAKECRRRYDAIQAATDAAEKRMAASLDADTTAETTAETTASDERWTLPSPLDSSSEASLGVKLCGLKKNGSSMSWIYSKVQTEADAVEDAAALGGRAVRQDVTPARAKRKMDDHLAPLVVLSDDEEPKKPKKPKKTGLLGGSTTTGSGWGHEDIVRQLAARIQQKISMSRVAKLLEHSFDKPCDDDEDFERMSLKLAIELWCPDDEDE